MDFCSAVAMFSVTYANPKNHSFQGQYDSKVAKFNDV